MNQQMDIDGPPQQDNAEFESWLDETVQPDRERVEAERIYWERKSLAWEASHGLGAFE